MRQDLTYGFHAVRHLLETAPERIFEIFAVHHRDDHRVLAIVALAEKQGMRVQRIPKQQLDTWLPGCPHQGIAMRSHRPELLTESDLEEILARCQTHREIPVLLILEGIQDPHNLGACLRVAEAAGVHAVILPKDRCVGITPTVRKVASGAAERVPVVQVTNLVRTLQYLKQHAIWIMGASGEAKNSLYTVDFSHPVAIVMGTEETGLRKLTRDTCDYLVHIPMLGQIESLNISVAAGICLYEGVRQRQLTS